MDLDRTPLTGTIAGRYEIRREAGRGGMAVVYLAWDLPHDRPVGSPDTYRSNPRVANSSGNRSYTQSRLRPYSSREYWWALR